jgi:23S rRNA (cytosine1962-C5)-methyltransferase
MALAFRAPGVALRIEALLERVRPSRGAARAVREGRLRWARTFGVGAPWKPGAELRDLRAEAPPGAAFWLDDASDAPAERLVPKSDIFELELPPLPWRSGVVPVRGGSRFAFEVVEWSGDRARVRFACEGEGASRVRAWAAQAGAPVIGDLLHGGTLAEPGEPLFAREGSLRISDAAARALGRGHPWLTRDHESEDDGRFAPGAVVELRSRSGASFGRARIEGGPQLVARIWSAASPGKPASVEERALRALARREKLLASGETDALRLVHGEADALPGLFVDRFGSALRLIVAGRAALPLWERAHAVLASALAKELGAEPSGVLVLALRPAPAGELECVRLVAGAAPPDPLVVREGALRFRVDLGLAEPARPRPGVGFFTDQRANRQRVASRVRPGGRYLNLFAHTGAFSAALLAAGAGELTSVDLSAPYLAQLEENLERSGLAGERHRSVRRDARRFVAELPAGERFDGIVLDPPTAAAAGRSFWSARGGLADLVEGCLRHLAPGGFLLVTCNDRSARSARLGDLVADAAARAGAQVRVADAAPSPDSPNLRGFPEGAAFKGVLVERAR